MREQETGRTARIEPRWPPVLAVLAVLLLLNLLSGRVRVAPSWVPFALVALVILPMIAVQVTGGRPPWRLVERWATAFFFLVACGANAGALAILINGIIKHKDELNGLVLFVSSIAGWVNNVVVFSLLYWQMDRGGPEARANDEGVRPDWLFPQSAALEDAPPGWRPAYVDYLFLAYSTATAFSATDVMPFTGRAKLLMMLESVISLAIIVVVASRAIGILGG